MQVEILSNKTQQATLGTSLPDAAVSFVSRGWPVIPLTGKLPAIPWKEFQHRLPTGEELFAWFTPTKNAPTGIGIITGKLSRLVVVDCDSSEDAVFWTTKYASSPLVVATGGGGVHLYYEMPAGSEVRNRQRLFGRAIDLRGEGGYVTAPPSTHPSGAQYVWSLFDVKAKLPEFNTNWLSMTDLASTTTTSLELVGVRNAVRYIRKIVAVAGKGGHNATFRAACKLRDAGLTEREALIVLSRWNETNATPRWSEAELSHKVRSAFAYARNSFRTP